MIKNRERFMQPFKVDSKINIMVRITTVLLRRKLKAMGNPREVGYESKDGYGTLHLSKDLRIAIIHPHEIIEVPEIIKVVLNKTTINKTTINNGK